MTRKRIFTLAAIIPALIAAFATTQANAVILKFDVVLDTIETTGSLATGDDANFAPVAFTTEAEVDLDTLAPNGPTFDSVSPTGLVFRSGASFDGSSAADPSPLTSGLLGLFPGLASTVMTERGGNIVSYDSFSILDSGLNERIFLPSTRALLRESIALSSGGTRELSHGYSFSLTRDGVYEEAGLPADRAPDATALLADYLFPGAIFEVRESLSTGGFDLINGLPDFSMVASGARTLRGSATLVAIVPEPSTALLFGFGLAWLGRQCGPRSASSAE